MKRGKGWRMIGKAIKSCSRGQIDFGAQALSVYESDDGRFQIQACREYDGYTIDSLGRRRSRFFTYYKLFDGEREVCQGNIAACKKAAADAALARAKRGGGKGK